MAFPDITSAPEPGGAESQRAGGRDLQAAIAAYNTYLGAAQIGARAQINLQGLALVKW